MDSRTHRACGNSYSDIWILTLKRICAEGLQQIMHGIRKEGTGFTIVFREFGGRSDR